MMKYCGKYWQAIAEKCQGSYTLTGFSPQRDVEKGIKPTLITSFERDHYKANFKTQTNY